MQNMSINKLIQTTCYSIIFNFIWFASICWALESDRHQPVHIESEHAKADYKSGYTVYSGNVRLKQGSLIIEADEITIYRGDAGVSEVIAEGQPAHLQQQPEINKAPIQARANIIHYKVNKEILELQDDVFIELEESTHQGDRYEYHLQTQVLNASGVKKGRVKVTFLPTKTESNQEPGNSETGDLEAEKTENPVDGDT